MTEQFLQFAYLAAAVLLILGMRGLASPKTAPRGNFTAAVGMLIAVIATLLTQGVVDYAVILAGVVVGSGIGALLATRIQMTAMPQMADPGLRRLSSGRRHRRPDPEQGRQPAAPGDAAPSHCAP